MNPDLINLNALSHTEPHPKANSSEYRKAVAELCEKSERLKSDAYRLQSKAAELGRRVLKTLREIHEHQPGVSSARR